MVTSFAMPAMPALAGLYPPAPDGIINLEHGYFGAMAQPVQTALVDAIAHLNTHLSPFLRSELALRHAGVLCARLAKLINCEPHEILLTRSASESMQVLIGQYAELAPGDAVLYSTLDYPAMRYAMAWLEKRRGVVPTELPLTLPISNDALLDQYATAIRDTPGLKLLLLSQVLPFNGQTVPVREIAALARARGIDVLLDSAHALGQLEVDVQALGVDFVGFNLHKWLGAPPGLGFAYIRSSRLDAIEPHFGDRDYPANDIRGRLHAGMPPMAAVMATPSALDVHDSLGGTAAKGARLAWLRNDWVRRVADLPGLRLMSPLVGDTALAAFTIDGMSARDVQAALLNRFGVFTVERQVGDISMVRATVALTTEPRELDRLVEGLTVLTRKA